MARKRSFVWTYLEEDGHLRRYAHDSCSSTQGCHVGRKKRRIKEGPTTMRRGFLPSDSSLQKACMLTDSRCLPSDPSLQKACMLTDSPVPATRDLLLPPGLPPGPTRYLHLLAAQDRSMLILLFPCAFAPGHQNIMHWDYCRILVVIIPALCNSCFFPIFSIAFLPFPITPIHNSVHPTPPYLPY